MTGLKTGGDGVCLQEGLNGLTDGMALMSWAVGAIGGRECDGERRLLEAAPLRGERLLAHQWTRSSTWTALTSCARRAPFVYLSVLKRFKRCTRLESSAIETCVRR